MLFGYGFVSEKTGNCDKVFIRLQTELSSMDENYLKSIKFVLIVA